MRGVGSAPPGESRPGPASTIPGRMTLRTDTDTELVQVSWEDALTDIGARIREATVDEHRGSPSQERRLAA